MILSKPLMAITGVSLIALAAAGFYIKVLIGNNALLKADNKAKTEQIISMESELLSQQERFEKTLETLELREQKIRKIEIRNSGLKRKLEDIAKNEEDECINTEHSPSISNILLGRDNEIPRETDSSVPSGDTP